MKLPAFGTEMKKRNKEKEVEFLYLFKTLLQVKIATYNVIDIMREYI